MLLPQDIIPLNDAKDYLGLDDTSRDQEVKRMTRSALRYVQKETNHILVGGTFTYPLECGCARVYDHPIQGAVPEGFQRHSRPGYYNYLGSGELSLTIGYNNVDDIPEDLIEAAYLMLKFFFYEQEGVGKVPQAVEDIVHHYKRYIA